MKNLRTSYKIGIIANQLFGTEDRLRIFETLEYIALAVAEEGVSKLGLKYLELLLARAKCMQAAVMIGDKLNNDIASTNNVRCENRMYKTGVGQVFPPRTEIEKSGCVTNNLIKTVCYLSVRILVAATEKPFLFQRKTVGRTQRVIYQNRRDDAKS